MNVKGISLIVTTIIVLIVGVFVYHNFIGYNDVQNFQIIQSMSGNVRVQSNGGYYIKFFDTVWTYPKVGTVFFSNDTKESNDKDGVEVIFSNKGRGDISSQVVYRLFTDNDKMLKMHQYAHGNIDIVDNLVLSRLKDIAMECASNITSSQAVEDREQLAINIRNGSTKGTNGFGIVNNKQLEETGIVVEQFSITKIEFDDQTNSLFKKQQEADLQKKTAEAERQNLIMQKEKEIAKYDKEIAESKGKAEVEKIKAITDAQRQKELAEINAAQKVAVEKQAKEEALVKASKTLELAEITKKEESVKLETIKILADQKVASAKAKEQEIKLSGAITEETKYRLDIEKEIKIGVAQALANGIGKMKLPETMIIDGNQPGNIKRGIDTFIQLMTVEKAKELNRK